MTIKKPMKTSATAAAPATAPGGATIASRLRLDAPPPVKSDHVAGLAPAFGVALVSLAVAGVLVYTLWKHWEFLMPA